MDKTRRIIAPLQQNSAFWLSSCDIIVDFRGRQGLLSHFILCKILASTVHNKSSKWAWQITNLCLTTVSCPQKTASALNFFYFRS